jgi:hypothetical protein
MSVDGFDSPQKWIVHRYKQECIGKQFHGFMHLPLTIRYMIYEHALVRGKIFVPNSFGFLRGPREQAEAGLSSTDFYSFKGQRHLDFAKYRMANNCSVQINPVTRGLFQGVSKAVQEEAEYVFWGIGNQFVFPASRFDIPMGFYSGGTNDRSETGKEGKLYVRHGRCRRYGSSLPAQDRHGRASGRCPFR